MMLYKVTADYDILRFDKTLYHIETLMYIFTNCRLQTDGLVMPTTPPPQYK